MSLGPAEILVVLVIALVVFGPKRLPEVGRQVGGALRELRKVQDTVQNEIRTALDDTGAPSLTMLHAGEPDLGDEDDDEDDDDDVDDFHRPDIDGLSGGTFS
jgi:TatA/E family protein of Tat protein translocase